MVPSSSAPFSAHCELQSLGEITVMQYRFTVDRFVRRARHIPSDARDSYLICMLASDTRSRIGQRNHEIEFGKGTPHLTLIDEPFSCSYDSPYMARGIAVSRNILRERLSGLSFDHAACLAPSPVWQHLDRYLAVLLETDFQGDAGLERQAEAYIVDLLALGLGARGDSAELATARGLRAVRLREAVAEIDRRYTDPAFSSDDLARAIGLSRRYVNELLHESGVSFSERVLELRLLKTRAMLSDPRHDRLRISDIAFACGFNEVSYFNRRFRARFGCSPTQCRGGK
ncbi:AraC family transcriptional regulator [Shinella zoogloeoides]